jgi:hypothetical protein
MLIKEKIIYNRKVYSKMSKFESRTQKITDFYKKHKETICVCVVSLIFWWFLLTGLLG